MWQYGETREKSEMGHKSEKFGRAREKEKERLQDGIVFSVFHAQILSVKIVIGQN